MDCDFGVINLLSMSTRIIRAMQQEIVERYLQNKHIYENLRPLHIRYLLLVAPCDGFSLRQSAAASKEQEQEPGNSRPLYMLYMQVITLFKKSKRNR